MLKIDLYDTFAIEKLENTLRCKDVAGLKYKNIHHNKPTIHIQFIIPLRGIQ